jgi:hypothetical protein
MLQTVSYRIRYFGKILHLFKLEKFCLLPCVYSTFVQGTVHVEYFTVFGRTQQYSGCHSLFVYLYTMQSTQPLDQCAVCPNLTLP